MRNCRKWTSEEEKFLKENYKKMSMEQLVKELDIPADKIKNKMWRMDLFARKWSDKEIEFLKENVGVMNYESIAKKLNRPVNGIELKAKRLGIGNTKTALGLITACQLAELLKVDRRVVFRWIEECGLNASKRRTRFSAQYTLIDPEIFWKWAFKNKDKINFSKIEPLSILPEPEWVEEQRKRDYHAIPKKKFQKWTPTEDRRLKMFIWDYGYTYDEVAKILGRSRNGVSHRWNRLLNGEVSSELFEKCYK